MERKTGSVIRQEEDVEINYVFQGLVARHFRLVLGNSPTLLLAHFY